MQHFVKDAQCYGTWEISKQFGVGLMGSICLGIVLPKSINIHSLEDYISTQQVSRLLKTKYKRLRLKQLLRIFIQMNIKSILLM